MTTKWPVLSLVNFQRCKKILCCPFYRQSSSWQVTNSIYTREITLTFFSTKIITVKWIIYQLILEDCCGGLKSERPLEISLPQHCWEYGQEMTEVTLPDRELMVGSDLEAKLPRNINRLSLSAEGRQFWNKGKCKRMLMAVRRSHCGVRTWFQPWHSNHNRLGFSPRSGAVRPARPLLHSYPGFPPSCRGVQLLSAEFFRCSKSTCVFHHPSKITMKKKYHFISPLLIRIPKPHTFKGYKFQDLKFYFS